MEQARTHQLLIHNKELLDHLQTLVRHIQELEAAATSAGKDKASMSSNNSIAAATAAGVTLPQVNDWAKRLCVLSYELCRFVNIFLSNHPTIKTFRSNVFFFCTRTSLCFKLLSLARRKSSCSFTINPVA